MAIPLAALLPVGGALLGGIGAYKKSGGDLGAAALGSGLGALSLGGLGGPLRFAGSKLAGTPLMAKIAPEAFKLGAGGQALMSGMGPAGITQAVKQAGLVSPIAQQMGGQQLLAKALPFGLGVGATLALAPGAADMAASVAGPVRSTAGAIPQTGAGLLGYQAPGEADYSGAVLPPNLGMYGGVTPYGLPTDVLGPAGMGQRLQTLKDAETMRDVARLLLPEEYKAAEARSKSEMARLMAAAGIRQNIATRAAMQQAAQTAGLNAGLNALNTAGEAVTRQYQYQ